MPTTLGPEYTTAYRGRYPHMLPEDIPLWDQFLTLNAHLFKRLFYDVRVGGTFPGPEYGDIKMREMFYQLTAKRIDVLAELENELWIIEVASKPGLRCTGQILSYIFLWNEDPKIMKPAIPYIIAPNIDSDLQRILTAYGVRIRLLGSM